MSNDSPSLFGIKNSNRDFSKADSWSKNNFNSSFPASLICYMDSVNIASVYLKLDETKNISKGYINAETLFGTKPNNDDLFFSFESQYLPYQIYTYGNAPSVDLMLFNKKTQKTYNGYEIKLTTLPDESTHNLTEDKYGCELVIRMPSIHFLACSIASIYNGSREKMKIYFGKNGFGNPASYQEAAQINPRLGDIGERMTQLIQDNLVKQKPLIIQPIWKTKGKSTSLADNCLDVFVWSDLAFTRLFMNEAIKIPNDVTIPVNRPTRAMIQLFFMLNEYYLTGKFNSTDIFQKLTYTMKNDKAFSVAGRKTNQLMSCQELLNPRIKKDEIKHIILGGGQRLLSPERRFDAALVNSPELFT